MRSRPGPPPPPIASAGLAGGDPGGGPGGTRAFGALDALPKWRIWRVVVGCDQRVFLDDAVTSARREWRTTAACLPQTTITRPARNAFSADTASIMVTCEQK